MRSIRTLLCAVTLLAPLTALPLRAQDDAARRAAATELLQLMRMEQTVIDGAIGMLDAQFQAQPGMEAFRDVMEEFIREALAWERIGPRLIALYAETYTETEMRDFMAFFRTPSGQRMLETQVDLMTRGAAIGQQEVVSRQDELRRRIERRAAELEGRSRP